MSIKPWSFSRIKAFEQCPKKFYHLKIAKDYSEPETDAMSYGTAFHLAAEEYVRDGTSIPDNFKFAQSALDGLKAKRSNTSPKSIRLWQGFCLLYLETLLRTLIPEI